MLKKAPAKDRADTRNSDLKELVMKAAWWPLSFGKEKKIRNASQYH
jgi:hypothetical protein